jgi:hypothetical protein
MDFEVQNGLSDGGGNAFLAESGSGDLTIARIIEKAHLDEGARHIGAEQDIKESLLHASVSILSAGRGGRPDEAVLNRAGEVFALF